MSTARLIFVTLLGLALSLAVPVRTEAAATLGSWTPMFKGIDHAVGTNQPGAGSPNLNVMHVLKVDLEDADIRLLATPPITNHEANARETGGMTVSRFLVTHGVQAAINANFFNPMDYYLPEGTPMDVAGLFISQGTVVSAQEGRDNAASVVFDVANHCTIIPTNWPAINTDGIYTAVSGGYPLVINGTNIGRKYLGDSDPVHGVNPRTAYGLSQDKRYLYLMTIDGRQSGYSEGAYDYETGAWLLLVGAYEGVNLDGGGSTTLVVQDTTGKAVRLNRPSAVADSGKERTVGAHLGVFAKPLPGFINDVAVLPDDEAATVTWTTLSPATSQVEYGPDLNFGLSTTLQDAMVTNHGVLLPGLTPDTGYYFRAVSTVESTRYVSSDLSFTTTNYVTTLPLLDVTNAWTFATANLDGVNWTAPGYDDSAWDGSGPGLLWVDVRPTGPNPDVEPKNTPMPADPNTGYPFVTYYFRAHFPLAHKASGATLRFSGYIDDGAVIYLNGAEIYRLRMDDAPTPIANSSLATGYPCAGDASCLDEFTVSSDLADNLVEGDNVLAVEVHNYNVHSADITFGLALDDAQPTATPPELNLAYSTGAITLSWTRGGFVLQQADAPGGPWADVPGPVVSSPYVDPGSGQTRYFRLHR